MDDEIRLLMEVHTTESKSIKAGTKSEHMNDSKAALERMVTSSQ